MKKVLTLIISGCISISFIKAQSTNDILNLLIQNKTITQQQADSIRAEAAIKQQDADANKKSFQVTSSKPLQLSGFAQVRYQNLDEKDKIDGFDIRRARLDLKGTISPYWGFRMQTEFAETPKLLDAYGEFKASKYFNITFGQFRVPFSLENTANTPKFEAIDLSQAVEAMAGRSKDVIGNHNGNDIGIQFNGGLFEINDKPLIDYYIGLFNGSGINQKDKNEAKSLAGRLVFHPVKGLDLGCSFYSGWDNFGATPKDQSRQRASFELKYEENGLSLRGEFITGNDGDIDRNGWYAQCGYYIIPQKLQLIFKYDTYDKDTSVPDNISTCYTGVLNYNFNSWSRIQVGYTFREEEGSYVSNNMGVIQYQIGF